MHQVPAGKRGKQAAFSKHQVLPTMPIRHSDPRASRLAQCGRAHASLCAWFITHNLYRAVFTLNGDPESLPISPLRLQNSNPERELRRKHGPVKPSLHGFAFSCVCVCFTGRQPSRLRERKNHPEHPNSLILICDTEQLISTSQALL